MSLNDYRDEAGRFLAAVGDADCPAERILAMLDEELAGLKQSLGDRAGTQHQAYDVLFLLMELAARYGLDLDAEWQAGRLRKQHKYLGGGDATSADHPA